MEPTIIKWRNRKKIKKMDILRSISRQSGESMESVQKKKRRKSMVGRICRKGRFKPGMKE